MNYSVNISSSWSNTIEYYDIYLTSDTGFSVGPNQDETTKQGSCSYPIPLSHNSSELHWRHNECDGVSNHRRLNYLLKRLFRCRSNKTSKLHVSALCEGNSPVTGEFRAQRVSSSEKKFPFDDVIMEGLLAFGGPMGILSPRSPLKMLPPLYELMGLLQDASSAET